MNRSERILFQDLTLETAPTVLSENIDCSDSIFYYMILHETQLQLVNLTGYSVIWSHLFSRRKRDSFRVENVHKKGINLTIS